MTSGLTLVLALYGDLELILRTKIIPSESWDWSETIEFLTTLRTVSRLIGVCSISSQMKSKPRFAACAATSTLLTLMTIPLILMKGSAKGIVSHDDADEMGWVLENKWIYPLGLCCGSLLSSVNRLMNWRQIAKASRQIPSRRLFHCCCPCCCWPSFAVTNTWIIGKILSHTSSMTVDSVVVPIYKLVGGNPTTLIFMAMIFSQRPL